MKAAVTTGKQNLELKDRPDPRPGPEEVVVRPEAVGICGTDRHIYRGEYKENFPVIMGHEISGSVLETGNNVKGIEPGDRIAVDPNIYCNSCSYCNQGDVNHCENLKAVGVTEDGGFAEKLAVPRTNIYRLPEDISAEKAALTEPLSCVLRGLDQIDLKAGERVLIMGGGLIGLMMAAVIRRYYSEKIVVAEPDGYRRDKAADFVPAVIDPHQKQPEDFATNVYQKMERNQPEVIIEASGSTAALKQGLETAGKQSRLLIFGVADRESTVDISPYEIYEKEIEIIGSFLNPFTSSRAVDLISRGELELEKLIDLKLSLTELPSFFAAGEEDSKNTENTRQASYNRYIKAMMVNQ